MSSIPEEGSISAAAITSVANALSIFTRVPLTVEILEHVDLTWHLLLPVV